MAKKLCKFSVLRYVPDEYREEFINIGLVMHVPKEETLRSKITSSFKRIKVFDDEIDIEFLKVVLEGVEDQFSLSTDHGPSLLELQSEDYLEKSTRYYVNQLQFSDVRKIYSEDIEKDFEDLFRTYVYFETKKKNRITPDEVKKLMRRVFINKGVYKQVDKNPLLYTSYNEPIELDYGINTPDTKYYMKALSVDYNKKDFPTTLAKMWVYNVERLLKNKDSIVDNSTNIEFKFILNNDELEDKNKKVFFDILSEISKPIFLKDLDEFLDKISIEKQVEKNAN